MGNKRSPMETSSSPVLDLKPDRESDQTVPPQLAREWHFTRIYQQHESDSPIKREAICLRAQTPGMMAPIREGDVLAGIWNETLVGLGSEDCGYGYFCHEKKIAALRDAPDASPELRRVAQELIDFWKTRSTSRRCAAVIARELSAGLPWVDDGIWLEKAGVAFPLYRLAGIQLDYDKLLHLGLSGLRGEVQRQQAAFAGDAQRVEFYDGLLSVIETMQEAIRLYRDQALALARESVNDAQRSRYEIMAATLAAVEEAPPRTFREAMQLFWIYTIVTNTTNYGRLDVYLGDFFAGDLDSGRMTEEEGVELLVGLWRVISANENVWNNRVMLGGMGRRNPANADRLAVAAMEAMRRFHHLIPNLTLRFHREQNPALYQKALDVIGEGNTHPMLYNDDVNVPAVAEAFGISRERAEQYLPFGCGEYILDHYSVGTPNGLLNVAKALDVTLHNGVDSFTGQRAGLALGEFRDFQTFEELFAAYARQVDWHMDHLARAQGIVYRESAREVSFLAISLLFDDCVARGLPVLGGGAGHLGGTMESFGNSTTADSLTAIKRLVYDEKQVTADELLSWLDGNFAGHEAERKRLAALPKYGNDDAEADAMLQRVHDQVCRSARDRAALGGMDSYLVVVINNSANVILGRTTPATADGRCSGKPMSNANQPTAGNDKRGLACLLNSLAKPNPAIHAGAVQNVKLSPEMFTRYRPALNGVLDTYWQRGGTQAMLTVVSRGMLEDALVHPENYPNLIVRVGGFSAYFVKLDPEVQQDILRRTLY